MSRIAGLGPDTFSKLEAKGGKLSPPTGFGLALAQMPAAAPDLPHQSSGERQKIARHLIDAALSREGRISPTQPKPASPSAPSSPGSDATTGDAKEPTERRVEHLAVWPPTHPPIGSMDRPWEGPRSSIPPALRETLSLMHDAYRAKGGRLDPQSWWQDMQAAEAGTVGARAKRKSDDEVRFDGLAPDEKKFLSDVLDYDLNQADPERIVATLAREGYHADSIPAHIVSIARKLQSGSPEGAPLSEIMKKAEPFVIEYDEFGDLPPEVEEKLRSYDETERTPEAVRERLRELLLFQKMSPSELWATALWAASYDPATNKFDVDEAARKGDMPKARLQVHLTAATARPGFGSRDRLQEEVRSALGLRSEAEAGVRSDDEAVRTPRKRPLDPRAFPLPDSAAAVREPLLDLEPFQGMSPREL